MENENGRVQVWIKWNDSSEKLRGKETDEWGNERIVKRCLCKYIQFEYIQIEHRQTIRPENNNGNKHDDNDNDGDDDDDGIDAST